LGERYSALVQTVAEAHPASCTMGTGSFFWGNTGGAWPSVPNPI